MSANRSSTTAPAAVGTDLATGLRAQVERDPTLADAAAVVAALAGVAVRMAGILAADPHTAGHGKVAGSANADGDQQRSLDVIANDLVVAALKGTPTSYYASEEEDAILTLAKTGTVAVAVDPLDGSSNIDVNVPVGLIFSIYPSAAGAAASFLRPAREQVGAGYFVFGPHTALAVTLGDGVEIYVLDGASGTFRLANPRAAIPVMCTEFAINASNYRHWLEPIRAFIDDCLAGAEGPREKDFNMRWIASLVAEAHRILVRGGVFLYPADKRKGYERGRLRHLYEAAPIAMIAEQAGGGAIDGLTRILDKTPTSLHERTPLIFGSSSKISRVQRYHTDPAFGREQTPLFAARGLYRA